jgi:hypothetical protein
MKPSSVTRPEFAKALAAGLVLIDRGDVERGVSAQPSTLRVAAVQMTADLANVDANLLKAERLTRLAFSRASRLHFFDSSCQTMSKPSRLLNAIRWTVERLRPSRPARSEAFRLRWSRNEDVPTITRSGHGG